MCLKRKLCELLNFCLNLRLMLYLHLKRFQESSKEFHQLQLLASVDSLELLKSSNSKQTAKLFEVESTSVTSIDAPVLPIYMKIPSKPRCSTLKATESEWKHLERAGNLKIERKSRESSVMFAPVTSTENSEKDTKSENVPEQNALHSIHQKCREAITGMNIESLLMTLCKDK
jgi:hypothetical protein